MIIKNNRKMKRFLIVLALLVLTALSGWTTVDAVTQGWTPPENYRSEESIGLMQETSENEGGIESSQDEMSMEDIFGSEQIFPFEPGLGN